MIVHFSTIQTMALAVIVFYLGKFLNNKFKFLKNNCIPDSVTGGTLFSFFILLGHETGSFSFIFEDSIKDIFMIAFFTTVGFSASIKLLKKSWPSCSNVFNSCYSSCHFAKCCWSRNGKNFRS